MNTKKHGYINDVDTLVANTPLDVVLQHYGLPTSKSGSGEHRMKCVFNEDCSDSQYGNLSVKLDTANRIYCHTCETKGNLLTLLHGLETHTPPTGGLLRGQEFKAAVVKLRQINGLADSPAGQSPVPISNKTVSKIRMVLADPAPTESNREHSEQLVNVPLRRHEKEAARKLADLHQDLVTDVGQMSPEAASYVRSRPWLTEELMQQWQIGWIPGNGRSMFRKHYFVFTHRNLRGDVVSYSGRSLNFDSKWEKWLRDGKPEGKKPAKYKYVAGYHRGLELYGGVATRLNEPDVQESLAKYGLVVVEGMTDVIRLSGIGVCAVGLGSNKATNHQIEKLTDFAQKVSDNRIMLLPDCDDDGEAGFKELLWRLSENGVRTRLGISSEMFGGRFAGKQPEDLTEADWKTISSTTVER